MKTMHLFAGAGGGILADLILGHEPVAAIEWEPYACQVLRERVEDGWFPGMQVWEGDVRLFDPSEHKGKVDCLSAGFPCTDLSVAGNQRGIGEDTSSGLYREVLRVADVVRPEKIFMENVSAILSLRERLYLIAVEKIRRQSLFSQEGEGKAARFIRHIIEIGEQAALGRVLGDLSARGYDAIWCCLSAAETAILTGQTPRHKRDRWWLLGYPEHSGQSAAEVTSSTGTGGDNNKARQEQASESSGPGQQYEDMADSKRIRQPGPGKCIDTSNQAQNREGKASDTVNDGKRPERKVEPGLGVLADDVAYRLGWNAVEADVGRVTNENNNRTKQLKALGNGQVPLQAATAFSILWQMMEAANEQAR